MSEFRAQCGCLIHVSQWTSRRKIASVKYCITHGGQSDRAALQKRFEEVSLELMNWVVAGCPQEHEGEALAVIAAREGLSIKAQLDGTK